MVLSNPILVPFFIESILQILRYCIHESKYLAAELLQTFQFKWKVIFIFTDP
jgi:hypothetical protein